MDIKKMSIEQLKALGWDKIAMSERIQVELGQINRMIAAKIAEANQGTPKGRKAVKPKKGSK